MKKYRRLTRADRIAIERLLGQRKNQSDIADKLNVHRSTISREIRRFKAIHSEYKWRGAQAKANCSRPMRIFYPRKIQGVLENQIQDLLKDGFSPEQISNRLKLENAKESVSHETIYKWVYYVDPSYKQYLRWKSRVRQKRGGRIRRSLNKFPKKLIDVRPESANERSECGHWERDLLEGRRGGPSLLVMVDRLTRYAVIRKINTKYASEVNRVTENALRGQSVKTITNDNGIEFGCYEDLEKALGAPVYYCHAYTSWERGSVENVNGLLRQFAPKHTDFNRWTNADVQRLQDKINCRPRKTHGYRSAKEMHELKNMKLIKSERYYRNRRVNSEMMLR